MPTDSYLQLPDIDTPEIEGDPSQQSYLGEWATREEAEYAVASLAEQLESYQQAYDGTSNDIEQLRAELDQIRNAPPPLPTPSPYEGYQYQPTPEPIDLTDLPDPTTDYVAYQYALQDKLAQREAVLAQQVASYVQQQVGASTQAVAAQTNINELWHQFEANYPDVVQYSSATRGAVEHELADMERRNPGYDRATLMLHDPYNFMERVAERVRTEVPSSYEEEAPGTEAEAEYTEEYLPRSAGIPTGRGYSRGNGQGGGPAWQTAESEFVNELREARRTSGFY